MTRGILLVGIARAASFGLGVVLLGVLGRRLGPGGFGSLQFALAVMAYPTLLVDLGLTTFGLREIARGSPSPAVIRAVLGARLALALAVSSVVALAVLMIPLDVESRLIMLILALGLPASAINARWVLQGEQRFGRAAGIEVLTTATQLGAALVLVGGPDDAGAAAVALTLASWVLAVASIVVAGQWSRFRPHIGRDVPLTILRSLPLGAAAIAITIYYSVDTVLLGLMRGSDEVAYYAAAYRVILPVLGLASAVATVAISHLSALEVDDRREADGTAVTLSRRLVLVALPISAGGALVAEPVIAAVYGGAFAPAAAPFTILVWSVTTVYANAAFAVLLLARGGDRPYLLATTVGAVLNVALNLVVIPLAGMVGAAAVTMVSELAVLGLIVWWTRDVALAGLAGALRAAVLPTAAMAVAVWPVRDSLVAVPIGAVVYGLVAVLAGSVPLKRLLDRSHLVGTG